MYRKYFGLDHLPFSIAVDPRFLYMSDRHRDALAHLIYGVGVGGGFILLSGEVGTGKTTITRCLLEQLPEETDIALILNSGLNAVELLAAVCDELGIDYQPDEVNLKDLSDKLHQFLLANHKRGRNTVLLIDEAQHLQFDVLEQIRLLTNLETNTKKLLQIILVGQPELKAMLARPELRQLSQRITARYQLKPFTLAETRGYIRHRLQVAGLPANQELFPPRVVQHIHQVSGGIPRLINVLCDRILLGTYGKNKARVDMTMARQAVTEVKGEDEELARSGGSSVWPIAAVALVLVAFALLFWQPWRQLIEPNTSVSRMQGQAVLEGALVEAKDVSATETATAISDPEPVVMEAKDPPLYFDRQSEAINQLLQVMGVIDEPLDYPCGELAKQGWRCEIFVVDNWPELISFNSPVVLEVLTRGKMKVWASLQRVEDEFAYLSNGDGEYEVPLAELGERWTGTFILPWQAPPGYKGPMRRPEESDAVAWLAQQFARLDGKEQSLADRRYNELLEQRVMMFQQGESLRVDGVAGFKTLLRINQRLGNGPVLVAAQVMENGAD